MELFADCHTHTTHSDGKGTPAENIAAAAARGLKSVAITDHGPGGLGIGVASPQTFLAIKEEVAGLAAGFPDIKVLVGAEAAVVGSDGRLDLPLSVIKQLDLLAAGLHPYYLPDSAGEALRYTLPNLLARVRRSERQKVRNTNTKALAGAVRRYPVDFITHPDLMLPVELDELARACAAAGTALEVNTGHNYNKDQIVHAAARHGASLIVNSDAHRPATVGDLAEGAALLEKLRFPPEMVLNALH